MMCLMIYFFSFQYRLARQNDVIASAMRTVGETEEVGMTIATELARNREVIDSARAKVG